MKPRPNAATPAETKLFRFPGGLRLRHHKAVSCAQPVEPAPLPARLYVPLWQLHGPEAELQEPRDAVLGAVGDVGVAGVAEDLLLLRPTQKRVHGQVEQLTLQVPQRIVHGADGVARQASGAVRGRGSLHLVPQAFRGQAALPFQQG